MKSCDNSTRNACIRWVNERKMPEKTKIINLILFLFVPFDALEIKLDFNSTCGPSCISTMKSNDNDNDNINTMNNVLTAQERDCQDESFSYARSMAT